MRKLLIIILTIVSFAAYSSNAPTAKVIVYRLYNKYKSAVDYKIYAEDSLLVRLKNKTFFTYNCPPGTYNFTVNKEKNTQLPLAVEAGKTYYIRLLINGGTLSTSTELMLVDNLQATSKIQNDQLTEIFYTNYELTASKNRIGANVGYGVGFSNLSMVSTTDGDESTLSFGGGIVYGINYGYRYNKSFDLSCEANFQFSMLMPYLRNAKANFNRTWVSVTPAYIIPFKNYDNFELRVGAGPDVYWFSQLILNTGNLPKGINNTYNYYKTLGFHIGTYFDLNLNTKWSVGLVLKYYYVKYKATYENPAPTDKLYTPNGSGVDMLIGLNYHF